MGACISCVSNTIVVARAVINLLDNLDINCTQEEFQQAHNSGTVEENKEGLAALGTDLANTTEDQLSKVAINKAIFICCNTYTKPSYSLGVGPMNDAITVATYMGKIGYTVYFYHNPQSKQFLSWLAFFLQHTQQHLVVYYTGHGGSIDDTNGDEADGKDECLVFDDAFVEDDKILDVVIKNKSNSLKFLVINDCCHSGSIWDFDSENCPTNCLSISAAKDTETAKQTTMDGVEQGMFTFYLFKLLSSDPKLTPTELEEKANPYLKKYEQCFTKYATTSSLLTSPLFE